MFYQLELLTLIFAPVMAYLGAALIFSLIGSKDNDLHHSVATSAIQYQDGQK